jgi:FAD:protein FMN transferase
MCKFTSEKFKRMKNIFEITGLAVLLIASLVSCKNAPEKEYYKYQGYIQGTTFSVIFEHTQDLAPQIDSVLNRFNQSLNNYDSTSLISRINRNESMQTDSLFERMFTIAEDVWEKSEGLFDISIAPLVNAWGFGYETGHFPDSVMLDSILNIVGFEKLSLKNHQLTKAYPEMQIIGNALAQGMSVDYLSQFLQLQGVDNFLVEIGGEIFAQGVNHHGEVWKVGVDKPIMDSLANNRSTLSGITLTKKAIATSGNYRKYHIVDGKMLGHALNPKTGFSEQTEVLSVSVIHDECGYADAWATAFMLLLPERTMEIVKQTPEMEVMIVLGNDNDSTYRIIKTLGFPE